MIGDDANKHKCLPSLGWGDKSTRTLLQGKGIYTNILDLTAMRKMPAEVRSFLTWAKEDLPISFTLAIVQEKESTLDIADADSDVLFDSERDDLTPENYDLLKARVLQSAKDFLALYEAFPDPHKTVYTPRKTFYGLTPVTAEEMYRHTKNVNAYYWGEIGVEVSNDGTMLENRIRGFQALETRDDYLSGKVFDGSWENNGLCRRCFEDFFGTTEFTRKPCIGWV